MFSELTHQNRLEYHLYTIRKLDKRLKFVALWSGINQPNDFTNNKKSLCIKKL